MTASTDPDCVANATSPNCESLHRAGICLANGPARIKSAIPIRFLDPDAVKTIKRLIRFGHEAYLVGGCVRDILIRKQPKDFDVVTSAHPVEIRNIFRNCRLIGRRFRLAHLHFRNGKIIEVATFRRSPTENDDISHRHAAENLFGSPSDDAVRRDFTINALMYDISSGEILDWVDGLKDLRNSLLRTIGDPDYRLTEDPVRILRAVKFGVKLDLAFDPALEEAMRRHSAGIRTCSPARLVEELFKILRSGSSAACFEMIHDIGALAHLMPNLSIGISRCGSTRDFRTYLEKADQMIKRGDDVSDSTLLSALLFEPCKSALSMGGDVSKHLDSVIRDIVKPMPFTRRHVARVKQILLAQRRLAAGPGTRRARRIVDRDFARDAIDILEITGFEKTNSDLVRSWRKVLGSK